MLGIYFSGTGNTKYCMEKLLVEIDPSAEIISLENENVVEKIKENEVIFFGYLTQFSNAPYFVREFIHQNKDIWKGKSVFCMVTMGAFSGDGAGCTARLFRKYGAKILGGLHIKMPDSVCDSKLLKKSLDENRALVRAADEKIKAVAMDIKNGKYPKDGITLWAHICGLMGQRLWYYGKTTNYTDKLKISDACTGCGLCEKECPMGNISIRDGKAVSMDRCTMCYRCISRCPNKAITLHGKEVKEQCRLEKYI